MTDETVKAAPPTAKRVLLDKSRRDVGKVTGTDIHGCAYTQVHKGRLCYFDAEGEEVVPLEEWATEQRPQTVNARRVYQRVNETDPLITTPSLKPEKPQEDDADAQDNSVNLTAWAADERRYRFSIVREAIEQRFGRHVPTEVEALIALLSEKVTTMDKIHPKYRALLAHKE